jgi:hypothetical protein
VSILAPAIIKKTRRVLTDATSRPSAVMTRGPDPRSIFPGWKRALLRKVKSRKRLIGIHPLFTDLKGILKRSSRIARKIIMYTVRFFMKKRHTTKNTYSKILIAGINGLP